MGRKKVTSKADAAAAAAAPAGDAASATAAALTPEQRMLAEKEKGAKAFQAGNYKAAVEAFTAALEAATTDEQSYPLYSNRSAAFAALQDFTAALKDAEKCVELAPTWPRGYFRKGHALEQLLQYPQAFEAYTAGLARDPNDAGLKAAHEALRAVLDELKITEQQLSDASNPDKDKFEVMCAWLREGGAQFPRLYLQYYSDDYRGVHCLTKIASDQCILYVPESHIMTSEKARESDIGRKIVESRVELRSKHSYLAAYLLQERHNPNSFWKPYLDILPEHYRNMPIFFTEEELALLKGSFTLAKIYERRESLRQEYELICSAVPEFAKYTQHEFVWARLVVITRIFGLVIHDLKTDGLVPYADMLNHKRPRETKWTYDDSRDGFTIITTRAVQRGEQVFDSYGRKCNSRFFVNYGFTLDDNEEDNEAVMYFSLMKHDVQYATKVRFLGGRESSANREFQVPATYREKKTKDMFSYVRFVHMNESEIIQLPTDPTKIEIDPISARNEVQVLEHIARSARVQLDGYDTTLEQDTELLKQGGLDFNTRNCIVLRRGEKQVLHWFVDLAARCVPLLKKEWKDVKRETAKHLGGASPFDDYVTNVVVPLVKKQG